jgi:hypothetical protein
MRIADFSVDDKTRQAIPVAEVIANGASNASFVLPETPTNTGTSVGSPNAVTNGVLMDDDEDEFLQSETSPFEIDDAFEYHKSNFAGKRRKPRQPSTSIAKLPSSKPKPAATNPVEVYLDDNGNEYEYLGQFDGKTDFLDEKYKGVVTKPGDHLYRRNTGVQFDGELAEYEYFIGDDPESSAIFGKLFKGIGKAVKKVGRFAGKNLKKGFKLIKKVAPYAIPGAGAGIAAKFIFKKRNNNNLLDLTDNLLKKNTNTLGESSNSTIKSLSFSGDEVEAYEYVGKTNGDLSFLSEVEPGIIVPPGAHIYRKQTSEAFDGDNAEFDYYIGHHPYQEEFLGKALKKIGKGIGKAAKAVGKGVSKAAKAVGKGAKNLGKFAVKKVLPLVTGATANESNGEVPPYNPKAGLDFGIGNEDVDWGDGLMNQQFRSNIDTSNVASATEEPQLPTAPQPNKTLTYVLIAAAVLAVIVYLKKNK